MGRRIYFSLFLAGLFIALCAAAGEKMPGYMDADYYYAGAIRIASGQGANEPYLWNYLNFPAALPAPAFAYWMPLVSLVAAAGLKLFPGWGFWGAQLPFVLLAGMIPPLTALLSYRLCRRPGLAGLAGVLALFPGFYLAYLGTSDVFALEMVLGALFLLLVTRDKAQPDHPGNRFSWWGTRFLGLGLLAGFFHLARADGIVWIAGALLAVFLWLRQEGRLSLVRLAVGTALVLAGYLLIMAPWMARNLREWGSLLPPGGSRAMWVSEYEQTMIFPASRLTLANWLSAGWGTHLRARLNAAGVILQTAVAVQGGILLFPFMLSGIWQMWRSLAVKVMVGMVALLAVLMTLVFPFAAVNGSFFHSAAALQTLLWALAPVGLDYLMSRYAQWRKLARPQDMLRFMAALTVITAILLSGGLYAQKVIGPRPDVMLWDASARHYQSIEKELVQQGAQPGEAVLVNNPPGYWLAGGRPALVIPYGGVDMLLAAARKYDARYLVLEANNPWQLADLFHRRNVPPGLEYLGSVGTTQLFRIKREE
jgi:hypothetical protein